MRSPHATAVYEMEIAVMANDTLSKSIRIGIDTGLSLLETDSWYGGCRGRS